MITSSSYIWAEYKFNDPYKYFKSQFVFEIKDLNILKIIEKEVTNKIKEKSTIFK